MSHAGKTYVVTGAASGIGQETTKFLRAAGATVIGLDIHAAPEANRTIHVDMSDPDSIDRAVLELPDGLNGLANIAGLPPTADPEMVLKVNILGLKKLTEAVLPKLADNAGIANLASLAGSGWPGAVDRAKQRLSLTLKDDIAAFCQKHNLLPNEGSSYFCSKEALIVWTKQNRWTWRDRGIRMNTASPGPVETPILKDFLDTLGARAQEDMRVMDRSASVDDVAPVVAFLLSEDSKWIRGANIECDGGMAAHLASEANGL